MVNMHEGRLGKTELSAPELFLSLLALADKSRHVIYEKREHLYGLSEGNINFLMALYRNGPLHLIELAKVMGVKKSTASVMIKRMMTKECSLFTISSDNRDARLKVLKLTQEGSNFIKQTLLPGLYEDITRFYSPLKLNEQEKFISLIDRVLNQKKPESAVNRHLKKSSDLKS